VDHRRLFLLWEAVLHGKASRDNMYAVKLTCCCSLECGVWHDWTTDAPQNMEEMVFYNPQSYQSNRNSGKRKRLEITKDSTSFRNVKCVFRENVHAKEIWVCVTDTTPRKAQRDD
jgi:uncharacterized protein (DUF2461 family)